VASAVVSMVTVRIRSLSGTDIRITLGYGRRETLLDCVPELICLGAVQWRTLVNTVTNLSVPLRGEEVRECLGEPLAP
jgi:hypothetical protein